MILSFVGHSGTFQHYVYGFREMNHKQSAMKLPYGINKCIAAIRRTYQERWGGVAWLRREAGAGASDWGLEGWPQEGWADPNRPRRPQAPAAEAEVPAALGAAPRTGAFRLPLPADHGGCCEGSPWWAATLQDEFKWGGGKSNKFWPFIRTCDGWVGKMVFKIFSC